ncbi:hypothetical protein HNY73_015562 [Argiope bruennichi]|uniref:Uncharacterized protein n=1 Tax=Argiope bruennichi TaxID=94029 RepID=A0A8T0EXY9_ARGBR|nr:hypothetical protein HNY73_015562 [Argiope bruennichi]
MKWIAILCLIASTVICFVRAQSLANETTSEDDEGVDMRMITGRLGNLIGRIYEKTDRYDLASQILRTVFEHIFVIFYRGQ